MTWLSSRYSKYRRNVHLLSMVILSVLLIINIAEFNQYLSQGFLAIFYQPFSRIRSAYEELSSVRAENERLNMELIEISQKLTQLEEMKRENIRLKSILGFEPPPNYELLPAEVIAFHGERTAASVTIDKGIYDSVKINHTLINQGGLVGRVISITPDFSVVQLLTDPANRVAARVSESREMGIVRYRIDQGLVLDNFPIQGNIEVGDQIISSGLGGVYPEGLTIGTVTSVNRPEEEAFCEINLSPAVNFASLEEIFILKEKTK